ncbi:MAG: hypothetical protein N4Q30_04745 [Neisseriaceae bacterium]|nr:hypothetical protein [Neisseriaceae bacterium]
MKLKKIFSVMLVSIVLTSCSQNLSQMETSDVANLAQKGNPEAQYIMGLAYQNGWDVEKDYTKSKEWFEKSAAQNNNEAMY